MVWAPVLFVMISADLDWRPIYCNVMTNLFSFHSFQFHTWWLFVLLKATALSSVSETWGCLRYLSSRSNLLLSLILKFLWVQMVLWQFDQLKVHTQLTSSALWSLHILQMRQKKTTQLMRIIPVNPTATIPTAIHASMDTSKLPDL